MHSSFRDILAAVGREPLWYDMNGTPRFDRFEPTLCPNIYSTTVVLLHIRCQKCGADFDVEMHTPWFGGWMTNTPPRKWHFGDPPAHGCVGDSMNCEDVSVKEVWTHPDVLGPWLRLSDQEGPSDRDRPDRK